MNNALSRVTGIMYGGCFFSTNKLISIIKKEKPDIVHLQCINGYFVNIYRLVTWLKKNHVKTVLTLHAEFMYTGGCGHSIDCDQWSTRTGCGHSKCPRWRSETKSMFFDRTGTMWKRMKKAFEGFEEDLTVVSVSPWLMERAKRSPIFEKMHHCVIFNGLDASIFHPYDTENLRQSYNCVGKKVVFHATPAFSADPNHLKGGYYVLELAKQMPETQFIVAGSYSQKIEVPENVMLLGKVTDQTELAQLYSMADVTLLTSKRETFSMVVAESLCCGTPVVGFKAGGPEEIAIPEYGRFVAHGEIDGLKREMSDLLHFLSIPSISEEATRLYSSQSMVEKYICTYQSKLGDNV